MITCEHDGGFPLDASVRIEAKHRQGSAGLLHYCARPTFAQERLRQVAPEHLVYENKKAGPGGKVSVLLTPHQLPDWLSALIPPPRRHLHRYYGVLAANSPYRPAVTALVSAESACNEGEAMRNILAHLGALAGPSLWKAAGSGGDDLWIQSLPDYGFNQRIAW